MVNPALVEMLTSAEATVRAGVKNVQKFHRIAKAHGIFPVLEAPGLRGAKFWNPRDIDRLRDAVATEPEAVA